MCKRWLANCQAPAFEHACGTVAVAGNMSESDVQRWLAVRRQHLTHFRIKAAVLEVLNSPVGRCAVAVSLCFCAGPHLCSANAVTFLCACSLCRQPGSFLQGAAACSDPHRTAAAALALLAAAPQLASLRLDGEGLQAVWPQMWLEPLPLGSCALAAGL